ncbi:hypothetical protein FPY71_05010 [Aureimonas fodinaquatilis]|uniref:Uncharacterized protein n=1 Tax=Aureimonas fodinaquatilis TaxID=2565783 RepID=A0A5B0E2A8_9HYPH|nr:hypothetical protein [Aureimonas fodinaquatilis]KAA0972452.1 hypothetical protein FPY71_05010 [Aureimonas fodinaquatilis]
MPPLILLGLVGAAAYYGVRRMQKEAARLSARNRQTEAELKNQAHGTLVRGEDGVYRPNID